MIDLHLHSKYSDGALSPAELVQRAKLRGVTAIALTDHDTCAGNGEAVEAGERLGVKVIPGVEFSVVVGQIAVHVLGFATDILTPQSAEAMEFLREGREKRLTVMVARLNDLGIPISSAEVRREAGGDIIGRLHVARVLHRRRFVGSVRESFVRYLGRGARAFVDRPRLEAGVALELIHSMGGVAVLAHPGTLEREAPGQTEGIVDELTALGLDGIEAYYSSHTQAQTEGYLKLAAKKLLLVTGGSDFHKPDADGPDIGTGTGRLKVPPEALAALEEAIAERRKAMGPQNPA